jgi:hypothetical protein
MQREKTGYHLMFLVGVLMVLLSGHPPVTRAQTCVEPPEGLVSWYPGDGDTTDIADENNGTLQGGATFAPGMVGQAFSLDGIDDSVEVPHNTNLNLQQALTIEAWIMKQGDCTNNCLIVMKQNDTTTPCCDSFRYGLLLFGAVGDFPGHVSLSFNTGVWEDVVVSQTVLEDHVWYHVAGTYDGSTAKIYVNGVLDNSVPKTGTILASTAGPLFIGQNVAGFGSVEFFNGFIDEVSLYNRALSDTEIQAIVNTGHAGKCKAPDNDGDGVPNDEDECPDSDLSAIVVIDGCNAGVLSTLFPNGCTFSDLIAACAEGARNHGRFVSCVSRVTNALKKAGTITGQQKGAIQSCAAQADIP